VLSPLPGTAWLNGRFVAVVLSVGDAWYGAVDEVR
jgi:hypothetical protein